MRWVSNRKKSSSGGRFDTLLVIIDDTTGTQVLLFMFPYGMSDSTDTYTTDRYRLALWRVAETFIRFGRNTLQFGREVASLFATLAVPLGNLLATHGSLDDGFACLFTDEHLISDLESEPLSERLGNRHLAVLPDCLTFTLAHTNSYHIHIGERFGQTLAAPTSLSDDAK